MDRRKFLKKTSSGVLSASLLPLLSFDVNKFHVFDYYNSDAEFEIYDQKIKFNLKFEPKLLSEFDSIGESHKKIEFIGKPLDYPTFTYNVLSLKKKTKKGNEIYDLTCEFWKEDSTDLEVKMVETIFTNEFKIEIQPKKSALLKTSKGKKEYTFLFSESKDDGKSCFLTSACVFHKGLPDDCYELNTLRNLRESVMKPNPEFQKLIAEYEIVAPQMLININRAANKNEILDAIYSHLVLPSVTLIESGKNEEAIEYYGDFVEEMKNLYLIN
jgi:hypothetical protein